MLHATPSMLLGPCSLQRQVDLTVAQEHTLDTTTNLPLLVKLQWHFADATYASVRVCLLAGASVREYSPSCYLEQNLSSGHTIPRACQAAHHCELGSHGVLDSPVVQ